MRFTRVDGDGGLARVVHDSRVLWQRAHGQSGSGRRLGIGGLGASHGDVLQLDRVPELVEGPRLDLSDPLARDAEVLAGLGEGAGRAVVEAVADAEDLLLALGEGAEQAVDLLVLELELDQALDGGRGVARSSVESCSK